MVKSDRTKIVERPVQQEALNDEVQKASGDGVRKHRRRSPSRATIRSSERGFDASRTASIPHLDSALPPSRPCGHALRHALYTVDDVRALPDDGNRYQRTPSSKSVKRNRQTRASNGSVQKGGERRALDAVLR